MAANKSVVSTLKLDSKKIKTPSVKTKKEEEKQEAERQATTQQTAKAQQALYDSMLEKALGATSQYAKQGAEQTREVANTVQGGMTTLNTGDKASFNWDTARQAQKAKAKAVDYYRALGLFDTQDYATDAANVNLVSSDYLKQMADELLLQKERAEEDDIAHDNYRKALQETATQYPQTAMYWQHMYNNLDAMDEETSPWFWGYADYLLNGDKSAEFDPSVYNDAWDAMTDDEREQDYARLKAQFDNLDWDTLTDKNRYDKELLDAKAYESQVPTYDAYIKTVNDEIARREELDALKEAIRADADYATLSAYVNPGSATTWEEVNSGKDRAYVNGENLKNFFINNPMTREEREQFIEDPGVAVNYGGAIYQAYFNAGYDYLTEDELADYNALYNAGRFDDAARYLELLRPELLQRRAGVNEQYYRTKAVSDVPSAIGSAVQSVAQGVGNIAMLPLQVYETAKGIDNPYSAAFDLSNAQGWTRNEQQSWIANQEDVANWLKDVEGFLYSGATGAADNFARTLAAGFNPALSLVFAGVQGASGALYDTAGNDEIEIGAKILKALTSGAYEVGTEFLRLDELFDMGKDSAVKYVLSNMASELGEETVNTLAEDVTEAVLAHLFNYESEIRSGADVWDDLLDTWYQTAGSTLFSSTGGATVMTTQNKNQVNKVNQNGDMNQVISIGKALGSDTESGKLAQKLQAKLDNGKKLRINEQGALIRAITEDVGAQNAQAVQDVLTESVTERLVELGESQEEAEKTAPAISKMYLGEKLSLQDRAMVNWSDNADQVMKELHETIQEGDENRTGKGWVMKSRENVMAQALRNAETTDRLEKALGVQRKQQTETQAQEGQQGETQKAEPKEAEVARTAAAVESARQKQEIVKDLNLNEKQVAYEGDGEETETGEFQRVEKNGGELVAVVKNGEGKEVSVSLEKVSGTGNEGTTAILEYAKDVGRNMSTAQINTMVKAYENEGGDAGAFIDSFENAYLAGYTGLEADQRREGIAAIAYEQGKAEAQADEQTRLERIRNAKRTSTGKVTWIGQVKIFSEITGKGSETSLTEAVQTLTENQKDVVRLVEKFAQKFGVDVVLYESDRNSADTLPNGQYSSETNTVYLDVLGGANTVEDVANLRKNGTLGNAMLKYLGHELTHAIENGSAQGYADYRTAVKEALRKRGQSYEALVRGKLETAAAQGVKLTLGGAEAEVIADASEFMLENTAYISNAPKSVMARVQKVISDFAKKVRQVFATLTGGHRESQALRELKDNMYRYVDNLQNLWDIAATEMADGERIVEKSKQILHDEAQNGQKTEQNAQEAEQNVPVEDVQFSLRDAEYLNAVESGETDTAQRMVDEAAREVGYTIRAYHGTGRADRVGTVFRADRATSGPMAFFTSDPQIAANYARNKADTSIAYDEEYADYYTQFRVKKNGKSIAVKDLWSSLPFSKKEQIKEAGKHITWDEDLENIIWDDDADAGIGNWNSYTLREHRGNALEALIDTWLESGELYGRESDFLQVLELAGIKGAEYRDPDTRYEKVYDTYLKIQNPFDTATADQDFIAGYEAWYQEQPEGKYDRQSADADMWDKNSMTAERFVARLQDDLTDGTTNAWTSIPDSVTDYLKSMGHDGIKDTGGKQGGASHTVWIPFASEQIKDASPVTYNDTGEVIPLSERFNSGEKDIRYSLREYGLKTIPTEDQENILARGNFVIESREDLLQRISEALAEKNFKAALFVGNVDKATRTQLEQETGITLFRDLDYAFGISADCIRHIAKHFNNAAEIADAVEITFSMLKDHDSVTPQKRSDGGMNLILKKNAAEIELEAPTWISRRTRSVTVKTAYITKNNKKRASPHQASIVDNRDSLGRVEQLNNSVLQTAESVNRERQYALRDDATAADVREVLSAMEVTDSMNATEKDMLTRYKAKLQAVQDWQKEIDQQKAIVESETATADEKAAAKARMRIYKEKQRRANSYLRTAEGSNGFARLMATSQELARRLTTQDVENAADSLGTEIGELTKKLDTVNQTLEQTRKTMKNAEVRAMFDPKKLGKAADTLKTGYGLKMSQQELRNRLAALYATYAGKAAKGRVGKAFVAELRNLAEDMYENQKAGQNYQSDLLETIGLDMGGTMQVSDSELEQLKVQGISYSEFKRALSPYIKVTRGGTGSQALATAQAAQYYAGGGTLAAMMEGVMNDVDALSILYETFVNEKSAMQEKNAPGMTRDQMIGSIMGDIMGELTMPDLGGETAKRLKAALKRSGANVEAAANVLSEAAEEARKSARDAGRVWSKIAEYEYEAKAAAEYYRALEEKRRLTELKEQKKTLTEQLKSEAAKKLAEQRERQMDLNAIRAQTEKNRATEKRIRTKVKRLDKLIRRETDQKHIPEGFKPVVEELMRLFINQNGLDVFGNPNTEAGKRAIDRAWATYELLGKVDGEDLHQMSDYYDYDVSQNLLELKQLLNKLGEETELAGTEKLRTKAAFMERTEEIVDMIAHTAENIGQIQIGEKRVALEQIAWRIKQELDKKETYSVSKGALGKVKGATKTLTYGNMTPAYFFRDMNLTPMTELSEELFRAENQYGKLFNEAQGKVAEMEQKYHYWDWIFDDTLTLTTQQGLSIKQPDRHKITIDKGMALQLYATWKRESQYDPLIQTNHLKEGGFEFATMQEVDGRLVADNTAHKISELDMRTIEDYLTEEQKNFADEFVKYLTELGGTLGNETSMELFGIKKFKDTYYFPIQVAKGQLYQQSNAGHGTTDDSRIKHMPFTNRRINQAVKPITIGSFVDVGTRHIQQMLTYHTFTVPLENMNKVLNQAYDDEDTGSRTTIREMIKQKYGQEAISYLEKFIADLNGGIRKDSTEKGFIRMLSSFKKGATAASLSVAIQQPTSIIRALAEVPARYFTPFTHGDTNTQYRKEWEQLKKHSGVAVIKDVGGIDMTRSGSMAEDLAGNLEDGYNAFKKAKLALGIGAPKGERGAAAMRQWDNMFGKLAETGDKVAWIAMWRAIKSETKDLNPSMDTTSDAFLDKAGERFNEVMRLTQVYDSTLARSQWMRSSSGLMKMVTSFGAEGTLTVNMLYDGFKNGDAKAKAKAAGIFFASQIITAAAAAIIKAGRDDDKDKTYAEKYLSAMGSALGGWGGAFNPLSALPGVRDIMNLLDGYDVERSDMSIVSDLIGEAEKLASGKYKDSPWKAVENAGGAIANAFGVPLKNIMRDARTLYNTALGLFDPPRASNQIVMSKDALDNFTLNVVFEPDTSVSAYYAKLYKAMEEGDTQEESDLREYLTIIGKDSQAIKTGLKNAAKAKYSEGKLTDEEAIQWLVENGYADDEDAAYWTVEEWKYKQENGTGSTYSKYADFYQAVETGENLKSTIKHYTDNGVTKSVLKGRVTDMYFDELLSLWMDGKKGEYANLLARMLTAYAALGYNRLEMQKEIEKKRDEKIKEKQKSTK